MSDPLELSLVDLAAALRERRVSPVELMDAVLAAVEATRDDLNAVVALRDHDELRAEARKAETRISVGGARPLEGIPLGVKDLEDAAGLVTSHGSLPFRDRLAARDSTQVARLRMAGAIVVGKTNAPEFGHTAITKNLVYGVTRSPWDRARTPGGSSGGSAAAIAGGVLPLATASDGGGSIRIPASFSGCFGLKPSFGRVPRGPFDRWEYGDTSVYGPLTRTVADAALVLDQIAGPSAWDPKSLPSSGVSYAGVLEDRLEPGARFAYSRDLGYAVVQSDVAAAVDEAVQVFRELGHEVVEVEGGPPPVGEAWAIMGAFELASELHGLLAQHRDDFGRSFVKALDLAAKMSPEWWGAMAEQRARVANWCAELFQTHDFLLTPTVPYDPPPAKGPFPAETEGREQNPAGAGSFTMPFNFSGHPASSVRAGLSRAGLPVGLQIVGPRHRDDLVLRASRDFEREHPWHPTWPGRG